MISAVGRASPLQGGGRRFESVITHHILNQLFILETKEVEGGVVAIYLDSLGIKEKIYIQAKPYEEPTLQEITSFLHITQAAKSKRIFISTEKFSNIIIELVKEKNMALIDHKSLIALCIKYKHNVQSGEFN